VIGRLIAAEAAFDLFLHPYRQRADRLMLTVQAA
jgi:hypothetical protein